MTSVAGTFVRSAIRMPVEIKGSLTRTARQQYLSVRKALETSRVYSRFELGGSDRLQCVFSPEPGLLLGETVRDWLAGTEPSPPNFLWCEQLGEDEIALVCVLDERVLRETFETAGTVQPEVEQLVRRGRAHDPDFRIFLHEVAPEALGLDSGEEVTVLEESVLNRVKRIRGGPPRVGSYRAAIARIATVYRLWRILLAGVLVAATVLPATYYGARWYYEIDMFVLTPSNLEKRKELRGEYGELLRTGDPGTIIPALHRAFARFLAAPEFGNFWKVERLSWTRGAGRLEIHALLPRGTSPPEDEGEAMSPARQARLLESARNRGWDLALDGFGGIFTLPVAWEARSAEEAKKLRMFPPSSSENSWHLERLTEDLAPVGVLENSGGFSHNAVYQTQSVALQLSRDPWVTGETAEWLGQRLGGGPLVLESVSLEALPDGTGGLMDGTIRLLLVWRNHG